MSDQQNEQKPLRAETEDDLDRLFAEAFAQFMEIRDAVLAELALETPRTLH
jgi:hypothetical protein